LNRLRDEVKLCGLAVSWEAKYQRAVPARFASRNRFIPFLLESFTAMYGQR
jgi:hypothetical protein